MKSSLSNLAASYKARITALQGIACVKDNLTELDALWTMALDTGDAAKAACAEADKRMMALMKRARDKVPDAIDELAALRIEKIELYVRATSNFASMMYETVRLNDDEQACIENSYRNTIRARYIGADGGARTVAAVKAQSRTYIDMKEIMSDEVSYKMRDIQQGAAIVAAAQGTVDIGWDLANKVDLEAYNLLLGGTINGVSYGTGVYGAFTTTGLKLARTYLPNKRINTANLPLTNDITNANLDDSAATNKFRLAVIRAILKYCESWGTIFGTAIRPTGAIFIPSSESTQLSEEIKPTGSTNNPIADGVMANFTTFDYMGIRWTLIPDVTLPLGRCYPVLNRPVGKIFTKPQMDQEFVETNAKKNLETRCASKVVAYTTLEPWRPFALRVAYSSAPSAQGDNE